MRKPVLAAGLAMGGLLLSAEIKSETGPDLIAVQTTLTVKARHDNGKDVPELNRDDVLAFERHERLQVTDLVAGESAGLELFLLLDDASSASVGVQLRDLRRFIEMQPPAAKIGVAYMCNGVVEIAQNLTADHGQAAQSLRLPFAFEGIMSSPYLSLSELIGRWPGHSSRREVVMVTSGIDLLGGSTDPYLDAAIADAQRNQILVYTIYTPGAGHVGHNFYRINLAQHHLAQIAEDTGGKAYMMGFGAPASLAPYLDEIRARLAHQYRVTFLTKAENKGGFRSVRFSTEVPNAELVAPARVYVPAAPEARIKKQGANDPNKDEDPCFWDTDYGCCGPIPDRSRGR